MCLYMPKYVYIIYVCVDVCVIRISLLLVSYDQVYYRKLNPITLESIDLKMWKENNSFNELCFSLLEIFKTF